MLSLVRFAIASTVELIIPSVNKMEATLRASPFARVITHAASHFKMSDKAISSLWLV